MKYEYPNLMLLDLESQASSFHCKYTRIIENRQQGTSVPDDMEQAHIELTGQIDNEYFLCNFSETQKQQKTGNWHCGILLIC
jgi:hypothetical protein